MPGRLIISPQAGFGNRLRALCAAKIFGIFTGRDVYHYWVEDPRKSKIPHVNEMKELDPHSIFDLKIPIFTGSNVDICFTEWMPGDGWFSEQSTAQNKLSCGAVKRLGRVNDVTSAVDDLLKCELPTILVETSLELNVPVLSDFRQTLMTETYKKYFPLNEKWRNLLSNIPKFDYGFSIRRGNFLIYNKNANIELEEMGNYINKFTGSKILFSDDQEYLEKVRSYANCILGINYSSAGLSGPDRYIAQFITLSNCRTVLGTANSSFAEQAALFGGAQFGEILKTLP